MCDNHEKTSNFVGGLVLGGLIGSGLVFLFGTKKGADVRKKIAREWPELSENLHDFVSDAQENIAEEMKTLPKKIDKARDTIEEAVNDFPSQVENSLHEARNVMKDIVRNAENTVTDTENTVADALEDAATNIHRTATSTKKRFFLRKK